MKRLVLALGLSAAALPGVALGFAYGGGGSLRFSPVRFDGEYNFAPSEVTSQVATTSLQFFDATYVMLTLGYCVNRGSTEPTPASTDTGFAVVLTGLSFGVAAKYPISLGPVTIFPLLGIEYLLNLTYTDDKDNNLKRSMDAPGSALNELWLKGGVGADVFIGRLFLRPIVTAGFKPLSGGSSATVTSSHPTGSISLELGTFAVDVSLMIGYQF